ncbi:Protein fem-1 -like protein C [Halotydeus destructor]|nr:Protein fem-1 -like protein C [Halotydeus destructor]
METNIEHLKQQFFLAARDGKVHRLKMTIEKVLACTDDAKSQEYQENRPAIEFLMNHKVNGATPLVIASKNGHADVVAFLIKQCQSDTEQVGNVQFDGETIEGAPPLWCAAAAGQFPVVRVLVESGANVNSTTKTKSTPLRAACYDGHLDIVQYLVENGADYEIANRHGHTCLMISCFKGHFKIARYLIEKGANINRKSVKGNTALHDCAESGSMEIMDLLLSSNANMDKDSYGVTPLIAAALTGHSHIVELIISLFKCSREEKIESLELLGATFVDKRRDMMGALNYWRKAITERNEEPKLAKHPQPKAVEAYDGAVEVESIRQLDEVFSDPDHMRMQALLVRERILGTTHPDTSYYIRYRGAVYADTGSFDKCIKLWMYALDMQQRSLSALNAMVQSSLLSFAELFSFMMSKPDVCLKFNDLFAVFNRALCSLQASMLSSKSEWDEMTPHHFHRTLMTVLHFVGLLCRLQPRLTSEEDFELKKAVYQFIQLNPRGKNQWTPLHLACAKDTSSQSVRFPLCDFPHPEMVKLFLEVGACPNDPDTDGNTPLHIVASVNPPATEILTMLLDKNAHIDAKNHLGETPVSLIAANPPLEQETVINPMRYLSLKCLAAQTVVKSGIQYQGIIGLKLEQFVREH